MTNAALLKRAMQYLDLTGVALSETASALREDGKRTAPETISRWLNGTNPVDPFLMGWITELVRSKAGKNIQPIVELPKPGLIIAVVNPKGGTGVTSLCMNLAATAKSLGMKTTYVYAETEDARRDADLVPMLLEPLWIDCPDMSPEKILQYQPSAREVVFVDVSNTVAWNSFIRPTDRNEPLSVDPKGFLDRFEPDLYLIPVDLESGMEASAVKDFLEGDALRAPVWIVHRPRSMSLNFASVAAKEGLDITSEIFYPSFIPQTASTSSPIPRDMLSQWRDEDQYHHHYQLFEAALNKLGGRIVESYSLQLQIERMNLGELLDLADKTSPPRRQSA
ncbi:ParA family protein [Pseudomonas hunanensis]|uniref:ParA family protein n=1 Tax=Pseudomonas hunanensis TaxID=1247546 RepID=UPI0030D82138